MIISHRYKFIFIKTNKTAGTSVEIALSKFCAGGDVITKNFPYEEKLKRQLGYCKAQNYRVPLYQYALNDWFEVLSRLSQGEKRLLKRYYSHSSAGEIRSICGNDIWEEYYKFCFERNPWDRVVSYYYFIKEERRRRGRSQLPLSEFIDSNSLQSLKKYGFDNYTLNGKIAVDRVCLYENLEAELEYVCNHILGIPEPLNLPRAKGQYRKDQRHYREILSPEDRDRIASIFEKEIELFGYVY